MIDTSFLDDMASAAPTPGGGGAAAYAGALAAALGSMVGNITAAKPKFAGVADDLRETVRRLDDCRAALVGLVDDDAQAFSALAATWKMPRETDAQKAERAEAEQRALIGACDVPMQIMRVCAKVIELDGMLAENASRLAISDVGASAILAKAALQAAALSVYVNTSLMADADQARAYEREVRELMRGFSDSADMAYDVVLHEILRKRQ